MLKFFSEIKRELKLPFIADGYNLVNLDGKALYVEGHKGIMSLGEELITFRVKGKIVSVFGSDLSLKILSGTTLMIAGNIRTVEVQ